MTAPSKNAPVSLSGANDAKSCNKVKLYRREHDTLYDLDAIKIPNYHRALNPTKVDALAESMAAIGLQTPIHVWFVEDDQERQTITLVAGHHRLAAAQKLGWDEIDCVFIDDMDEIERELWSIDENLCRANLTDAQEAAHLARRKELFELRTGGKTFPTSLSDGRKAG